MSPPPRWKKCPRKGELVLDKFLPFKTPLDIRYANALSPNELFTPEMFISSAKSNNIRIGLWIDLTNTNRYYKKETIEKNGIAYCKLACKGHKQAPSREETRTFVNICDNFISRNPLSVIAVHCTHGFNRTGFLICAYLVEKFDWAVDAALTTFSICRSPGIYKDDYIRELFRRYGEIEDAPLAPTKPSWCFEEDQELNLDDDGDQIQHSESNNDNHSRRSNNKSKFMEGISGFEFVDNTQLANRLRSKVQKICRFELKGFPGSQPVSMSHDNLYLIQKKPYKVSWKADGTRYMMLIERENEIYLFDRDYSVFKIVEGCPKFPRRKHPNEHIFDTLLDGEMVIDIVDGVNYPRYLIYDIVSFENQKVGDTNFEIRTCCITKEIILSRETAKQEGRIDRSLESFGIRKKDFWDLEMTRKLFSDKFNRNVTHEIDGLIFQPINDPYTAGQCPNILKWKPHTHNSIDFRVRILRYNNPGCLPETLASLQVGRENTEMGRIKATKEFRESDNKIVECTYDYVNKSWKFMRVRTDKSYPNSYDTAIAVWNTIQKPLTKDQLLSFIDNYRFVHQGMKRPQKPN